MFHVKVYKRSIWTTAVTLTYNHMEQAKNQESTNDFIHLVHETSKKCWLLVRGHLEQMGDSQVTRLARAVIIKAKSNTEEFKSTEIIYNPLLRCVKGEGCGALK